LTDNNTTGRTIDGEVLHSSESDKINKAIALHYDGMEAPTVTAKGYDEVAKEIYRIAKENNIPMHEDAELVSLLSRLDIGDEIPKNLYIAVAEVIAFAYLVSGKAEAWAKENPQNKN